jgi:hypothetical protein
LITDLNSEYQAIKHAFKSNQYKNKINIQAK